MSESVKKKTVIRVAIVEDNPSIRDSLKQLVELSSECRCVGVCANAEAALSQLPELRPEVVLMDIEMPGMSGIACTGRLKQLLPSVQVIMVTVYEDTEKISASLRAGACGYLLKRCKPDELIAGIREARLGGVPMPREVARKVIGTFQQPILAVGEVRTLTPSERKVLDLLAQGLTNKEIADQLGLSGNTVRRYLERVYAQLRVHSRTEAVLKVQATRNV